MSEAAKQHLSDINTGKSRPKEVVDRIIASKRKNGSLTHSEKTKEKMRKPKEKVTCPHCGVTGGISSMMRWHFDRCKSNLN